MDTQQQPVSPKKVRTSVSLPADFYAEIERLAAQKKVSIAWVIREAVEQYLSRQTPLFRNQ